MGVASIVGIVNQKGGTGKTTSCVNLGVDLAHEGKKVLLVDCDPQGSLTISLGHPQPDALSVTLADLMGKAMNDEPIASGEGVLRHEEGVDLLPANIELSGTEVSLFQAMSREQVLRNILNTCFLRSGVRPYKTQNIYAPFTGKEEPVAESKDQKQPH